MNNRTRLVFNVVVSWLWLSAGPVEAVSNPGGLGRWDS